MNGNNNKRNKAAAASSRRIILWVVCLVLTMVLIALLVFAFTLRNTSAELNQNTQSATAQPTGFQTGDSVATEPPYQVIPDLTTPEATTFQLGDNVQITGVVQYVGTFMEDHTDEFVSGVLAIRVTNNGDKYIQTMDITLSAGESQAAFSLSSLFPGDTVIVLEKSRMAYDTALEFTSATASNVAIFDVPPQMCEDKLEIQCLDGVLNVRNISGEDIAGDILIYYKNCINGQYYGGITYRVRIQGGLKAGEIRQGSAAHFHEDTSALVFVTCG